MTPYDEAEWARRQEETAKTQQEAFGKERDTCNPEYAMKQLRQNNRRGREEMELEGDERRREKLEKRREQLEKKREQEMWRKKFCAELSAFDTTVSPTVHSSGRWIEENRNSIDYIIRNAIGFGAENRALLSSILSATRIYPVNFTFVISTT